MIERELWLEIANACESHQVGTETIDVCFRFRSRNFYGICDVVHSMYNRGEISYRRQKCMLARLHCKKPDTAQLYWWPFTHEGHLTRAKICRELAEEASNGNDD